MILEVSSEQAEKLNVANELGKLSLALRGGELTRGNEQSAGADSSRKPTWAGDVSSALIGPALPAPESPIDRPSVQVLHGTKNAETIKQP